MFTTNGESKSYTDLVAGITCTVEETNTGGAAVSYSPVDCRLREWRSSSTPDTPVTVTNTFTPSGPVRRSRRRRDASGCGDSGRCGSGHGSGSTSHDRLTTTEAALTSGPGCAGSLSSGWVGWLASRSVVGNTVPITFRHLPFRAGR